MADVLCPLECQLKLTPIVRNGLEQCIWVLVRVCIVRGIKPELAQDDEGFS